MSKVVLLAPTPPPAGGIAGWTVRMVNATLKNNWQVVVVDERAIGNRQAFGDKTNPNLIMEAGRCLRIWKDLIAALRDPEVLVVHSCIPSTPLAMLREYVCACITKAARRKFIIHFRCTVPNTTKGRFAHVMLKSLCGKSDLIMTLNEQTNDYLGKFTDKEKRLIPNFVTEKEVMKREQIRKKIERVLYVGGVVEAKGAIDILEVARSFSDIQFRLVGKAETQVEEYAREHGILNAVFAGTQSREEVKHEMENADVFMFLTYFPGEGFSNALVEAMAVGLPCIATDWAANRDMLEDKGGFIVPIRDAKAAIDALNSMMDPGVRAKQSEWNSHKVKTSYVDRIVLDQYVDAYENM